MDFPFQDCFVPAENFSAPRVGELLKYEHSMAYSLLDLKRFEADMQKFAEEKILARYLSGPEQVYLQKLTLEKRKREWLGGRFAAKHAAACVLGQSGNNGPYPGLSIMPDENGRPFLAATTKNVALPDISISHSGDLAAAMAVSQGLCGIDIQKITDRVVKVRNRFCSPNEEHIIQSFFKTFRAEQSSTLTKLWAAKEALRKAAAIDALPGFLELELTGITTASPHTAAPPYQFTFLWKHMDMHGSQLDEKCCVAVSHFADYALALTARDDTVA
jgi:phosphopantetheinyl transferase (holo-ACP synthase)